MAFKPLTIRMYFSPPPKKAKCKFIKTSGNSDTHIILRGVNPNFDENAVKNVITALTEAEVNESIMIDNSHGNSQKQPKKQIDVTTNVCDQIASGNRFIRGIMLESHLNEGNQKISENLNYGQSITDACMGWKTCFMSCEIFLKQ